jgi:hypothetical protein
LLGLDFNILTVISWGITFYFIDTEVISMIKEARGVRDK